MSKKTISIGLLVVFFIILFYLYLIIDKIEYNSTTTIQYAPNEYGVSSVKRSKKQYIYNKDAK